jgi:hypothetical protein
VERDLAERSAAAERILGRVGYFRQRFRWKEALLGYEPLDLLAELRSELLLVACDSAPGRRAPSHQAGPHG